MLMLVVYQAIIHLLTPLNDASNPKLKYVLIELYIEK